MIRAIALALLATPALSQDLIVPFTDEGQQDPDFAAWRAELMLDVIARDADAVAEKADENIKLSFGGDSGRETLMAWLTEGEAPETYWQELEEVLSLGGTFDGEDAFTAPYTFTAELPGNLDPFSTAFVLGHETPVREGSAPDSFEIARVTGAVVETIGAEDFDAPYRQIRRADGSEGYVEARFLRSVVDYRALFNKLDGEWRMTAFIAGD